MAVVLLLVVASALLHAAWNAQLKREPAKDVAGVAVVGVAALVAILVAVFEVVLRGSSPFPNVRSVAWSLVAGGGEAAYFVALVRALAAAPLGVAYTLSRGLAIAIVWPLSVLFLGERVTMIAACGAAIVVVGLVASADLRGVSRRGVWLAGACGVSIATYHLAYKQAMASGAAPAAVFAVSLALALPINVAVLGRVRRVALVAQFQTRTLRLAGLGVVCSASFLLFLLALRGGGAGLVLALRNTSIVFAALAGLALGERPTRVALVGVALVTVGAVLVGAGA